MTDLREQILNILEQVCENAIVKENLDVLSFKEGIFLLFEEGILDSFSTLSLLVEIQERLGIKVSISDFDCDEWATPNLIIQKLKEIR
ncbi:D-alanine--poly(phosphoribitol) ligase subunit 2 [Bacillus cereus]|nr:D-alanine--poly(phosphoribitol) ligase subunit 2 [Bacillus cereus]PGU63857.1 D-alanine--poly(phosphoribitol) ligase subunit 2 [Bacillus cereus]